MISPRELEIKNYDYPLPEARIARYPLEERDRSKLLVARPDGAIVDCHFSDLPACLPDASFLVLNDTRVIQARMLFHKPTGGGVEIFCLEPESPRDYQLNFSCEEECTWKCLVGNSKRWKEGLLTRVCTLADGREVTLYAERAGTLGATQSIRFHWTCTGARPTFSALLEAMGELPIPPYLNRPAEEHDKVTYQTVYAHVKGSVAAPTAGLHFTPTVFEALAQKGIQPHYVTLHVGAGTFRPVKSATIGGHDMHTEFIAVPRALLVALHNFLSHRAEGVPLVAVGTTSVRTLESLYYIAVHLSSLLATTPAREIPVEALTVTQWEPYETSPTLTTREAIQQLLQYLDARGEDTLIANTQILIAPGFQFRLVERMITNFHLPQSTLLLLISAFLDGDDLNGPRWHDIYRHALAENYRFLSYGDSSLLYGKKIEY